METDNNVMIVGCGIEVEDCVVGGMIMGNKMQ